MRAVATLTSGILYVSYIFQNDTRSTVHAVVDDRALKISGIRGLPRVQQVDAGAAGEIAPGGMETGVIACTPGTNRVSIAWRLRDQNGNALPLELTVELR